MSWKRPCGLAVWGCAHVAPGASEGKSKSVTAARAGPGLVRQPPCWPHQPHPIHSRFPSQPDPCPPCGPTLSPGGGSPGLVPPPPHLPPASGLGLVQLPSRVLAVRLASAMRLRCSLVDVVGAGAHGHHSNTTPPLIILPTMDTRPCLSSRPETHGDGHCAVTSSGETSLSVVPQTDFGGLSHHHQPLDTQAAVWGPALPAEPWPHTQPSVS